MTYSSLFLGVFLFHSNPCSTLPFWYKSLEFQSCDLWHMKGNLCSYFENWSHWNYQTVVPKRHLTDAILRKKMYQRVSFHQFYGHRKHKLLTTFPIWYANKKNMVFIDVRLHKWPHGCNRQILSNQLVRNNLYVFGLRGAVDHLSTHRQMWK